MGCLHHSAVRSLASSAVQGWHGESGVVVHPPGAHDIELKKAVVHATEMMEEEDEYERVSHVLQARIEYQTSDIESRLLPLTDRTTVTIERFGKPDFVVVANQSDITASLSTLVVERRPLQRRNELRRTNAPA